MVRCPTMMVRGTRSNRVSAADVARLQRDYRQIRLETVDSQHDVPGQAAEALVAHVRRFIEAI